MTKIFQGQLPAGFRRSPALQQPQLSFALGYERFGVGM